MEAQAEATEALLNPERPLPNVVGFALGVKYRGGQPTREPALVALVNRKLPREFLADRDVVPEQVAGMRTDVFDIGQPVALRSGTFVRTELSELPPLNVQPSTRARPPFDGDGGGYMDEGRLLAPPMQLAPSAVAPQLLTRRMRPAPAGASIGVVGITAGTLGSVVYDFARPGGRRT